MYSFQLQDIINKLQSSSLSKRQLNILSSLIDEFNGDLTKEYELNKLRTRAGAGIEDDIKVLLEEAFEAIDSSLLKRFNDFIEDEIILTPNLLEPGKLIPWKPIVRNSLRKDFDAEEIDLLVEALHKVFSIKTIGFGKGELLITLLTCGYKGIDGDVKTPFGEIEVKCEGRLISSKLPRGDSGEVEIEIFKLVNTYEELTQLEPHIWDYSAKTQKSGPYTPNAKNIKGTYRVINRALTRKKREDFWFDFVHIYIDIFHTYAVKERIVDYDLVNKIIYNLIDDNIEEAIELLGVLQYDIYKRADGFDYLFIMNDTYIFPIKSIGDLIGKSSLLKSDKPLKMTAPVIGPEGMQADTTRFVIA